MTNLAAELGEYMAKDALRLMDALDDLAAESFLNMFLKGCVAEAEEALAASVYRFRERVADVVDDKTAAHERHVIDLERILACNRLHMAHALASVALEELRKP